MLVAWGEFTLLQDPNLSHNGLRGYSSFATTCLVGGNDSCPSRTHPSVMVNRVLCHAGAGTLPAQWSDYTADTAYLQTLDFSGNNLTGGIDVVPLDCCCPGKCTGSPSFAPLPQRVFCAGTVPASWSKFTNLRKLQVQRNRLGGEPPMMTECKVFFSWCKLLELASASD